MKDGRQLKPEDIDQMEEEIFQKLSNVNTNIALDAFHPRLVATGKRKNTNLDKYG